MTFRETSRRLSAAVLALTLALRVAAQAPPDEVGDFFRTTRFPPTEEQAKVLDTQWRLLQIGTRNERREARRSIVELGRVATGFLEKELLTGNAEETRHAAMALGRIGDASVASVLRRIVSADKKGPGAVGRRHSAMTLGQLGGEADEEILLRAATRWKRNEQRRAALYALGKVGTARSIPGLQKILARERSQQLRAAVLMALGRIGSEDAIPLLRSGRKSGKETVRRAATLALADLRDPRLFDDLRAQLADKDDDVVAYALIGLSLIRHEKISAALKRRILKLEDEHAALAVTALGMQSDQKSLDLLLSRMKPRARRPRVVKQALAFAFARRDAPKAAAALKKLLEDRDSEVVRAALCAGALLRSQGSGAFLPELVKKRDLDDDLRLTGFEILAYHAPERARQTAESMIREGNDKKKILERAREILEILGGDPASAHAEMRARVQVLVDDLGGSPEWNLLKGLQQELRRNENVDRPIDGRSGGGTSPTGQPRPPEVWTKEDEDIRLWFDMFPYYDGRRAMDVR